MSSTYKVAPMTNTIVHVEPTFVSPRPPQSGTPRLTQNGTMVDESKTPLLTRWYGTIQASFSSFFLQFTQKVVTRFPWTTITVSVLISLLFGFFAVRNIGLSTDERIWNFDDAVTSRLYQEQRSKFRQPYREFRLIYEFSPTANFKDGLLEVMGFENWLRNFTAPSAVAPHNPISYNDVCFRYFNSSALGVSGSGPPSTTAASAASALLSPVPPPCAVESVMAVWGHDPLRLAASADPRADIAAFFDAANGSAATSWLAGPQRVLSSRRLDTAATTLRSAFRLRVAARQGGGGRLAAEEDADEQAAEEAAGWEAVAYAASFRLLGDKGVAHAAERRAVLRKRRGAAAAAAAAAAEAAAAQSPAHGGDGAFTPSVVARVHLAQSTTSGSQFWSTYGTAMALYGLGLLLMCVVAVVVLSDCRACADSRCLVGATGIVSTLLAVLCGMGLVAMCGIQANLLSVMAPFLVVAIGFDDTFFILAGVEHTHRNFRKDPRVHLSKSIGESCTAVSMTSFTDIAAFAVGSFSAIPGIRHFCLTTALCILADYLLQMTFVVAVVYLDLKRARAGRIDCLPCCCCKVKPADKVHLSAWKRFLRSTFSSLAKALQNKIVTAVVVAVFAVAFFLSVLAIPKISIGVGDISLRDASSSYRHLQDARRAAFPERNARTYLYLPRPTLAQLPQFATAISALRSHPEVLGIDVRPLSHLHSFLTTATPASITHPFQTNASTAIAAIAAAVAANASNASATLPLAHMAPPLSPPPPLAAAMAALSPGPASLPSLLAAASSLPASATMRAAIAAGVSGEVEVDLDRDGRADTQDSYPGAMEQPSSDELAMATLLLAFTQQPLFAHHAHSSVSLPLTTETVRVRASVNAMLRLRVTLTDQPSTPLALQRMRSLSQAVKQQSDSIGVYVFTTRDIELERTGVLPVEAVKNMAFAAVTVCLTLLVTMKPAAVLMIFLSILILDVLLFGAMYAAGVGINIYSFANIVFSIGFSVDYSVHICHTFMEYPIGDKQRRVTHALVTAGPSVFHGVLTTIIGALVLTFATTVAFRLFAIMIVACASVGFLLGVVLLPTLLSRFGPAPNSQEEYVPGRGGMRGW